MDGRIKKLLVVDGYEPSKELQNKMLDVCNSIVTELGSELWDEAIFTIYQTIGNYANKKLKNYLTFPKIICDVGVHIQNLGFYYEVTTRKPLESNIYAR